MQRRKKSSGKKVLAIVLAVIGLLSVIAAAIFIVKQGELDPPEELFQTYTKHLSDKEYGKMYEMIDLESSGNISQEQFVTRNSKIYEGIDVQNIEVSDLVVADKESGTKAITYHTKFDTAAGQVEFENEAKFVKGKEGYRLIWQDSLIHPDLKEGDKVQVITTQAKRGSVLDRNGALLAGPQVASSVGVVPGKLGQELEAVNQLAPLLEMEPSEIQAKLSEEWVTDDAFVPLQTLPKLQELDLQKAEKDQEAAKEKERQEKLLSIPGVMITDIEVRGYPLKQAAAHLIGYVQNVTAEDLQEHEGKGYTETSVIGKSGVEVLYEKELKGENGCEIFISDASGERKVLLASVARQDGQDIRLTIDAKAQTLLYEQFQEDKSCSVAMNPYTGEVLALVSTPSFDDNDFILGMSSEKWTAINEDEKKPMYNRFRQVWCPGSTFKPIVAAIGLKTGAVNPQEDYGNVGLSWQKDSSWGSYLVTTLQAYEPVVLENALKYSDNIYFAKAALKIGAEDMAASLDKLGFNQEAPFEIKLEQSQYSNTGVLDTEIQLADSGYGQAQILVNPVHLASLYTCFVNDGNVIKPSLLYREEPAKEQWIPNAFSSEAANTILEGMKKVVNDPDGTGSAARREDMQLAGKTGTAEIKDSKEDTSGTELGWFAVTTTDPQMKNPILVVSMAEDVKEIGGSGYVTNKVVNMLNQYLIQ